MSCIMFYFAVLLAYTLSSGAAQSASCNGRCGDKYYRGSVCQCDYNCFRYGECCGDYQSVCTTKNSCKGRCGEGFQRGRKCSCDEECVKYKQCCPDYNDYCDEGDDQIDPTSYPQDDPGAEKKVPVFSEGTSGSLLNEWEITTEPYITRTTPELTKTSTIFYTDATSEVAGVTKYDRETANATLLLETTSIDMTSEPPTSATTEDNTALFTSTAPTETSTEVKKGTTELSTAPATTLTIPYESSTSTTEQTEITTATTVPPTTPEATAFETKFTEPPGNLDKPIPEPAMNPGEYQADDSNDTNLCSGRPITGVTTLRNGTVVVFRGHYFWFLDPNRVPGPARDITQFWGVPSPIDTVFTRCNCQGKTYIFKGGKFWRFENDALDSGYPKVVETGFDGLRGPITAALSVPQIRSRREAVYFFKRGGTVQKYSYRFGTNPSCGRKPHFTIHTVQNQRVRRAVSVLEAAINIRTSWRGFPPTVTAAVSVPDTRETSGYTGYKFYIFSGSKSYKVQMDGDHPVMESPKPASFVKCPNAV